MQRTSSATGWVLASMLVGCGNGSGSDGDVWNNESSGSSGRASADDGTGTGASADVTGSASAEGTTTTSASGADETTAGPIFDVGVGETSVDDGCGCGLTYIWIANADDGTVSKIDTRTLQEEGRYITRPDGAGNPSRTSVNLSGDVAIANRYGGLVKFHADESDCVESNGMPGIQTSLGANNVLGWDVEECRAWYTAFATTNQRPVAWTPGTIVEGSCDSEGEQVWTVMSTVAGLGPGIGGAGGVTVSLLDGEDGSIAEQIDVADFSGFQLGAYGGAVDAEGNLYFVPMGAVSFNNQLARVDIEDFTVTLWPIPAGIATYGITVDHDGDVWVSSTLGASAARFEVDTETWTPIMAGFVSLGGLAEGPDDHIWVAADGGARSIDMGTLMPGPAFIGGGTIKGISVDADNYVWAVSDVAYKIDAATGQVEGTYNGLTSPYTYSDMTGHALANTFCPPAG